MLSAFNKEIFRSIKGTFSRFLAIILIVALGTGFYAGLRMTAPDMKLAADKFYDETNLYDIRILSTMGITDEDIEALEALDEVEAVMPAYEVDMVTFINGSQYTVRIHSLDTELVVGSEYADGLNTFPDDDTSINRPILVEGNWPSKAGECVLSANRVMDTPIQIGDKVELIEGLQEVDRTLNAKEYTVVGLVNSSYYSSPTSLGSTYLGSGYIQQYMFIGKSDFSNELAYSEAFVTAKGAKSEIAAGDLYKQVVSFTQQAIEGISSAREKARYTQIKNDAQEKYDKAYAEYLDEQIKVETELESAKTFLDEAAANILTSEQAIVQGQAEYDNGVVGLAFNKTQGQATLDETYRQLVEFQAQIDAAEPSLVQAEADLQSAWATWQQSADEVAAGYALLAILIPGSADYLQLEACLSAAQQSLDVAKTQLDEKQVSLDAGKVEMAAKKDELTQGWAAYNNAQQSGVLQINSAQTQLDNAAVALDNARATLEAGKVEYEENLALYEQSKAEAEEKFAEAKAELADAQEEIDAIEYPTWYVLDRTKNMGAENFQSDTGRIDQIAQVFPLLFFLVAALVALTTMTRMVEEERMIIGTYKALGYSKGRIASKYVIYAASASVVGSALGIIVLSQVLPMVIFNAYAIVYSIPSGPTPLNLELTLLSAGLGIGTTLIATAAAAVNSLRENPAALMLPRAPKPGKRILLERVTPLWKHVSFSWKVTFRNIFRYKRRFIMTIIGIAGCSALLLTGLGLSNAINDIISKQYYDIYRYNAIVKMEFDVSAADQKKLNTIIENDTYIHDSMSTYETAFKGTNDVGKEYMVYVIVPENIKDFSRFISIRNRETHLPYDLSDNSLILCEKLANQLNLGIGDTAQFSEIDEMGNAVGELYEFKIGGICENYVGGYAYMSPKYFEKVTGKDLQYTTLVASVPADSSVRNELSDSLLAIDGVKTVGYNDESIESYQSMLKSVDSIVVVLIIAAAVLAFVVLYNLTNININERQREIATLKVLGFIPREVDAYIFRETILLTIIGGLLGLIFGIFMENYVVVTAEVDAVMFGREIHTLSFVIAFFVTLIFALFVAFAMRKKLKAINMVESLKSVE